MLNLAQNVEPLNQQKRTGRATVTTGDLKLLYLEYHWFAYPSAIKTVSLFQQ
jgi:hypothetical protein